MNNHNRQPQPYHANVCVDYMDGLVQDCSNSSALAMELLQSCAKMAQHKMPLTPVH